MRMLRLIVQQQSCLCALHLTVVHTGGTKAWSRPLTWLAVSPLSAMRRRSEALSVVEMGKNTQLARRLRYRVVSGTLPQMVTDTSKCSLPGGNPPAPVSNLPRRTSGWHFRHHLHLLFYDPTAFPMSCVSSLRPPCIRQVHYRSICSRVAMASDGRLYSALPDYISPYHAENPPGQSWQTSRLSPSITTRTAA